MNKIKKGICFALVSLGIVLGLSAEKTTITPSELGNKNLKGIRYIIAGVQFNGVLYGEGYLDRNEEEVKEINLKEITAKLKADGIPITIKTVRKIYGKIVEQVQKEEIEVLKMKLYSEEKSTIIPMLTARIDAMTAGEDLYFIVAHLTLSKWLSNWSGTKRILAPVYTWSAKKMASTGSDGMSETIETAVNQLMETFLAEFKEANREEEPEEEKTEEEKEG
ncbi:MAG: hypothetical protein GY950_05840 [bacterium]|nr:hypothetical protein [bacterium]